MGGKNSRRNTDVATACVVAEMAGRPRAKQVIVTAQEIMAPAIIATERWRLGTLFPQLSDTPACLQWVARRRLIHNDVQCPQCGQPASLVARANRLDGVQWQCSRCRFSQSVRHGSFFERSHLAISKILLMMYCWCCDMPQHLICREADMPLGHTVVDWSNFFRDEAENYVERQSREIGGMDLNGEAITVEIDESKFFHRKYHRGQWRQGHWVFGGIERESGKCFLVEVADRTANTLEAKIREHILPGTHIISDGWAAYANIPQIGGGIYTHEYVVHQRNFVDPQDDNIHTQNVENLWWRAKRKIRRQQGTSRELFTSYLHEFIFRNSLRDKDIFVEMINCIGESYPM